jgi:hypothetical protein
LVTSFGVLADEAGLTVHLYNAATTPEAVIRRAVEGTSKIFNAAGVHLTWRHYGHEGTPAVSFPAATEIFIWLLPKELSERTRGNPAAAGSALRVGTGEYPNLAMMFYDRINEAARISRSSRSAVLGAFMAHEIGHLLLGPDAHQPFSLMRHTWETDEFRAAERGALRFMDEEAIRIRAEVTRRMRGARQLSPIAPGKPAPEQRPLIAAPLTM